MSIRDFKKKLKKENLTDPKFILLKTSLLYVVLNVLCKEYVHVFCLKDF